MPYVKLWLQRHGANSSEIPVYVSYLRELFHQPSEEAYISKLEELKTKWSNSFLEYYLESIHPEVSMYAYMYVWCFSILP